MSKDQIAKAEAVAMWDRLRDQFINATRAIKAIIATKAWEPLGYQSFAQAWRKEMSGITLAEEIRPHIVYQLIEDNVPLAEIADMVGGIGPTLAESLARQHRNGVPADAAVVREHVRRKPRPADTLHLKVGTTMFYEYRRVAAELGQNVEEIAIEAVREKFAAIVSERASKRKAKAS